MKENTREASRAAYSCSTSGLGCSHGPCGRNHRKSSRSADDHRSRLRSHHHSYHPEGSSWRCGQRVHTCSIPDRQRGGRSRQLGGIRERCDRQHRNGSKTSPWELQCIHGLERCKQLISVADPNVRVEPGSLTDMSLSYAIEKLG
ncbi:hypothetical protein BDW72DRAFT_19392 [Aspergillus terricola var. indicus]